MSEDLCSGPNQSSELTFCGRIIDFRGNEAFGCERHGMELEFAAGIRRFLHEYCANRKETGI